jgi:hypothetical protein
VRRALQGGGVAVSAQPEHLTRLLSEHPRVYTREESPGDWTASACGCVAHGPTEAGARQQLTAMLVRAALLQADDCDRDAERARARAVACERRARALRDAVAAAVLSDVGGGR